MTFRNPRELTPAHRACNWREILQIKLAYYMVRVRNHPVDCYPELPKQRELLLFLWYEHCPLPLQLLVERLLHWRHQRP